MSEERVQCLVCKRIEPLDIDACNRTNPPTFPTCHGRVMYLLHRPSVRVLVPVGDPWDWYRAREAILP